MKTIRRPDNGIHIPTPEQPSDPAPAPEPDRSDRRSFLQKIHEEIGYASTLEIAKEKFTRRMWVNFIVSILPLLIVLGTWPKVDMLFSFGFCGLVWGWIVCPVNYYSKYQEEKRRIAAAEKQAAYERYIKTRRKQPEL